MQRGHYKTPDIKKKYVNWIIIGEPIPYLVKFCHNVRWKVLCECTCGRRDLIDIQNLKNGRSKRCVVCGYKKNGKRIAALARRRAVRIEAFGENKTLSEWITDPRCIFKHVNTLYKKLKAGMDPEDIITLQSRLGASRKLNNEQIKEVYIRANAGERGIDLAREFMISGTMVSQIKTGKIHTDAII